MHCPIDDVCVFSVLDLVKRLLTKVVRMSTAKGPQPNSTSAADRNKVTTSLGFNEINISMSRNPFSRFSKQFFQMPRWQP